MLDVLFLSTDKDTPGQAYEINIKENNTGFSDLTFKMPSYIINEEGEKVINPKLTLIEGKRISAGKQKTMAWFHCVRLDTIELFVTWEKKQ